ncbi:hypothetical protein HYZ70_03845 [Candidatus Curtissbacteria bacterium]|nr:hypothetical protein [Candidatus Curtissbacteria bacterium]
MPNQFTHPWTFEEIAFLEKNINKLTYKQMSVHVNRSPASIQSKIRYLPFQQKVKKHQINSDFFKKWSYDMAYVLGFIAADGNICHTGRAHMLHIACDDKDVIEKIKGVISYEGPIREKLRINGKISYSLRICDPIMFNDLENLGVTERKSLTFTPPIINKSFISHFIRGYFDGDGSVTLRKNGENCRLRVYIYTASLNMANFLQDIMVKILGETYNANIVAKLAHQKTKYYVINLGHKASLVLFNYMYGNAEFYMDRKYKKFLEGMGKWQ